MKQDLILLHGALGSKLQLDPLKSELENDFNVHSFNFEGHGDRSSNNELSILRFAKNLKEFITQKKLDQPDIFGYSMGGYVALFLEASHPNSVGKIMTLGTKFNWNPEGAAKEVRMLNPNIIEEKVPRFAEHLSQMQAPNDWKVNMLKTADMMSAMEEKPPLNENLYRQINSEVLLTLGDKDQMVTREETEFVLKQLSNAKLVIFPEFQHPIEKVNTIQLAVGIKKFFE
ncbi:MAG: alpha/beta hydrolase [Crocinitomicaceae bacterium]|nr:alpha/beta hydrolase [Crocinitomicaceae bacterium]